MVEQKQLKIYPYVDVLITWPPNDYMYLLVSCCSPLYHYLAYLLLYNKDLATIYNPQYTLSRFDALWELCTHSC